MMTENATFLSFWADESQARNPIGSALIINKLFVKVTNKARLGRIFTHLFLVN